MHHQNHIVVLALKKYTASSPAATGYTAHTSHTGERDCKYDDDDTCGAHTVQGHTFMNQRPMVRSSPLSLRGGLLHKLLQL